MGNWLFHLLKWLPPRWLGHAFARLQRYLADTRNPAVGEYAVACNNPQALCFLMDVFPALQSVLLKYGRGECIRFLDIGPAFGASAGVISQMYCSNFLGPRVQVDALDIVDSRRDYINATYPLVNFIHSAIEDIPPTEQWDIIYCSNAIEHHERPSEFVKEIMRRCKGYGIFIAPYMESIPLSPGHTGQISERTFDGLTIHRFGIFQSAAWPTTSDGTERRQCVAVVSSH